MPTAGAQAITNDRPQFFGLATAESQFASGSSRPSIADTNRPVVEQVAADRNLVSAMMVMLRVVRSKATVSRLSMLPPLSACGYYAQVLPLPLMALNTTFWPS